MDETPQGIGQRVILILVVVSAFYGLYAYSEGMEERMIEARQVETPEAAHVKPIDWPRIHEPKPRGSNLSRTGTPPDIFRSPGPVKEPPGPFAAPSRPDGS